MALFFKRLRRLLLDERKFGKYLLYAMGEILILIIGILFAVEINNQNQKKQDKIVEISILKTIKGDLERDLENLQMDIGTHNEALVSSVIIQDHLERNLAYNDSLPYHFITSFVTSMWMNNSGGIQSLKSLGVNTVTNEELRSDIIFLYDVWYVYKRYLTELLNNRVTFGEEQVLIGKFDQAQYFDDYDTEKRWDGSMIPLNYEGLKNDKEYIYHLKSFYNATEFYLKECCDRTKELQIKAISDLGKEIEKLEE